MRDTPGGWCHATFDRRERRRAYLFHVHRTHVDNPGARRFPAIARGERKLTDTDLLVAAQMMVDLQGFYNEGFAATDYVSAKALFAQGLSAMMVAGTADFTGFKEENPDADLDFIPWPGPEAGKYATNTGYEL